MMNSLFRALLAFALVVASAAHGADVTPLPRIMPDDVEQLTVAQLDARAAAGDLKAQAELGARYARGAGTEVDLQKAVSLFEAASRKNEANAQYYLGTAYLTGTGVKQDPAQAARWFKKAAAKGHAGAQYSLGVMMAGGEGGLKADPKSAAAHVLKSAEQGFIPAAFRMAQLHIAGMGVPRDTERAADWYRRILKTQSHNPSFAGLTVLIETREAKWQPGDPTSPPPPLDGPTDDPSARNDKEIAAGATAAVAPVAPARDLTNLPYEPETITAFKTEQGATIDVKTAAGRLTLFSTSDKPYQCQIDVKFSYLDEGGNRQAGRFACYSRARDAGQKVEVCDVEHRNFVQTKIEKIELLNCDPAAPK